MGDAADELWDHLMMKELDFDMMVLSIRENCNHPHDACRIVSAEYEDGDDWLPYRCTVCGQGFDFP